MRGCHLKTACSSCTELLEHPQDQTSRAADNRRFYMQGWSNAMLSDEFVLLRKIAERAEVLRPIKPGVPSDAFVKFWSALDDYALWRRGMTDDDDPAEPAPRRHYTGLTGLRHYAGLPSGPESCAVTWRDAGGNSHRCTLFLSLHDKTTGEHEELQQDGSTIKHVELVEWQGVKMRIGRCIDLEEYCCPACDRLGWHLEPVESER